MLDVSKTSVLHIEDEADLRALMSDILATQFPDRLELVQVDSVERVIGALRDGRFALVLSDLKIVGGLSPLEMVVDHLRERTRGALVVLSGGGHFQLQSPLPDTIHFSVLTKPFRFLELQQKVAEALVFLEQDSAQDPERVDSVLSGGESSFHPKEAGFFSFPEGGFASFEALMKALPTDPQQMEPPDIEQAGLAFDLVGGGLYSLRAALDESPDPETFVARTREIFPLEKRESLLKLLGSTSPASFVLDIAWHDVNNALGALNHSPEAWGKVQARLHLILDPALRAFTAYSTRRDPRVFLEQVPVRVEDLTRGFNPVEVENLNGTEIVELPQGGMRSLLDTFLSNALKVAAQAGRSTYELGLSIRKVEGSAGPYLEFVVWDDLSAFSMDQLLVLFDRRLKKSSGWGMGTGLQRLGDIVHASWEGMASGLPFTMAFSQPDMEGENDQFYFKQRAERLLLSAHADLGQSVPVSYRRPKQKAFVFRLPLHQTE